MKIEFENVKKKLGGFVLKDISFEIPQGYICGLVGPNGSGKTTLLHLMLGLYLPTEGRVRLDGKSYEEAEEELLNRIGTVLTEELFDRSLTLLQNGEKYGRFYRNYSEEVFRGYLKRFQLDEKRLFKRLSRGEKLKFQFAFALSHNADLLILDEPTGNFDPEFRKEFFKLLKEFIADGSRSVVLASHLTEDLDKMADYLIYLEKGNMIFANDMETLRDSYRLVTGELYKIKLIRPERMIHTEEGKYGTKALVKHFGSSKYDTSLSVNIPTIEELMYFMTKRGN